MIGRNFGRVTDGWAECKGAVTLEMSMCACVGQHLYVCLFNKHSALIQLDAVEHSKEQIS